MRICQICCRFNMFRAPQMSPLLCLGPHVFLGQKSYLRVAGEVEAGRPAARPPPTPPSRRAVASHSPLSAAWQRRPLNPVARALAGPKSGPRARTWDEVGGKEEPAVHPRSPSSPAPHARRWRCISLRAQATHRWLARAVAAQSPSPSTPAPLGPARPATAAASRKGEPGAPRGRCLMSFAAPSSR